MPSQILHVLAGRRALGIPVQTCSSVSHSALYCPQPFNIGCQGPDVFAHNRRTKPFALAYARLLHRRKYGLFVVECLKEYSARPDAVFACWLAGFVTHQAVDRVLHPYIVYKSTQAQASVLKGVTPALHHAFLERILDVCMLSHLEGHAVRDFDTGQSFFLEPSVIELLSAPIARALLRTFPAETVSDTDCIKRVSNAFVDAVYFYQLTNPSVTSMHFDSGVSALRHFIDRGYAGVALLFPDAPDPEVDWLNLGGEKWLHPVTGTKYRTSVPELFEQASRIAAASAACLNDVMEGTCTPASLVDCIGNGSLGAAGLDGRVGVVTYSDPFPLDRVLYEEANKRAQWLQGESVDPIS